MTFWWIELGRTIDKAFEARDYCYLSELIKTHLIVGDIFLLMNVITHTHAHTYTHTHTRARARARTHVHVPSHTHIHTYIGSVQQCTYARAHTRERTHT